MSSKTLKRILKILSNVLMYLFVVLGILLVALAILAKTVQTGDERSNILGYQARVVVSDSMNSHPDTDVSAYDIKSIRTKALIFIQTVPNSSAEANEWYSKLKVGDVLTFTYNYQRQDVITHRIREISKNSDGGYVIKLVGDNKAHTGATPLEQTIDTSIPNNPNKIIGKVTGQSYLLGLIMTALKNPLGMILIIIVPCLGIIVLEVLRIIRVVNQDKKAKLEKALLDQNSELEDMRRRLAMYEQQDAQTEQGSTPEHAKDPPDEA